jgi:hypothetical protein
VVISIEQNEYCNTNSDVIVIPPINYILKNITKEIKPITPLRIENAQLASSLSLITPHEVGVLNEQRYKTNSKTLSKKLSKTLSKPLSKKLSKPLSKKLSKPLSKKLSKTIRKTIRKTPGKSIKI